MNRSVLQLLLLMCLLVSYSSAGWLSCLWGRIMVGECCDEPFVKPDFKNMAKELDDAVFGQHIVQETVIPALQAHFARQHSKPLVLSFNGATGTGKNHVARIIANNIYKKGFASRYVHRIMAVTEFPDRTRMHQYKVQLQKLLVDSVRECGRAMFIFDEVDKLPEQLLSSIKPFLDYNDEVSGVDFRNAIFLFLSNDGGDAISQVAVSQRASGKPRSRLRVADLEKTVTEYIYNSPGGLKMSELISNQLIDHFIPFLPLEREHVRKCVIVYLNLLDPVAAQDDALVEDILHGLIFFPPSNPVFCNSGCKRLEQKSDVALAEWKQKRIPKFGGEAGKSHDEI